MKLKQLRLQNFFSHEDSIVNFDNVDSISLIVGAIAGSDRESNGAGKSSIIEGILFALYEKTRLTSNKNATLDDIVRWNSNGIALIELQFEVNEVLYKIVRSRDINKSKSTATLEVFDKGKWKSLTAEKKSSTNKEILTLIKLDYDTFCAAICFQPKEIDNFISSTDSQRKELIKNILQLDKYEQYKIDAKAKIVLCEAELQAINKELEAVNINPIDIELKKQQIHVLSTKINAYEQEKKALEQALEKLHKQQIQFNLQVEQRISVAKQIKEKSEIIQRLDQANKVAADKQINYKKLYEAKLVEYNKLETQFREVEAKPILDKADILKEGKAADSNLKQAEKELEELSQQHFKLSGEIENIDRDIKNIEKLDAARCPTCFHQISIESKQSSIQFLNSHKKLLLQQHESSVERHSLGKQHVQLCRKALEDAKEKLQEYGKITKEKLHLQDSLKLVKEALDESLMIATDQLSIIKENTSFVEQYTSDIDRLKSELDSISLDQDQFEYLNKTIADKNSKLQDCNKLLTDNQLSRSRLQVEVEQMEKAVERIKARSSQRDTIQRDKFYYEQLVKLFGKDIPSFIIENTCYELSQEANSVLKNISNDSIEFVTQRQNKDGTMREVFEVEITRPGIEKPILIDSLSNGQKFRVVFAIRVALSRLLVRRRNSTTMDFLFYDECFSSLDDKGIDDVIDVFRYLRNEFKHQIIITHRTDLKERFGKNVIIVRQDTNGISKVNI